ncbi:MAG: hypothetical protein OHK0032_04270 [Thermodesulfovibrionales bacterium]
MECRGFNGWLACLSCSYICTKMCPIERKDVIEEMKRQIHLSCISGMAEDKENNRKEKDKLVH